MSVIEINTNQDLNFILTRSNKVVIFFYVDWISACNKFEGTFITVSRKNQYKGIVFCQVNMDLLLDIQEIYDVDERKSPVVVFIKNNEIVNKMYGNYCAVFDDYMYDFSKS